MAIGDLLHSMSNLVLTCTRHVSRASRKLGLVFTGRKQPSVPSLLHPRPRPCHHRKKQLTTASSSSSTDTAAVEESDRIMKDESEGEDGVWRCTILLGERCQPLDFSGAIHYDSCGRRLAEPTPRHAVPAARSPRLHTVLQPSQLKPPPQKE